MALGFGFNKAKVLSAAEKYVQQGRFNNAVSEYEKVIREDPKDLTVLNTVGDLYARLGRPEQALQCFRKVGEAYAADGFTVKAIAMYKKVVKLSPTSTDCILKLAELYTQQGLYSDARAQYLHVAEHHLRSNEDEKACGIFQKMLQLDPENSAMQKRLAELYAKMNRPQEARNIYFSAAESHFKKGALELTDEALQRALGVDPDFVPALVLRGEISSTLGRHEAAIQYLERVPNLDSQPESLRALLRSHLALRHLEEAAPIATKLLVVHNDLSGIRDCADALMSAGEFEPALRLYEQHADRLLSSNGNGLLMGLHSCIDHVKDNAPALEMLRDLYRKGGDSTHLNEINELLAHALVQGGELERARDLYRQLSELEPENPVHAQNYKQIVAKLGGETLARPLTPEEGEQAFMVEELEIAGPELDQQYPSEIALAVKAAITDSELLDCYNLPAKALAPLEAVLPLAPQDARLNQRLASLYARAGRLADAARCCDTLREAYWKANYSEHALRYSDMAAHYRQRLGEAGGEPLAQAEPTSRPVEPEPQELDAVAAAHQPGRIPELESKEIDLSPEWDAISSAAEPAAASEAQAEGTSHFISSEQALAGHTSAVGDLIEEIRFYISQGMADEAAAAIDKCRSLAPDLPPLTELCEQLQTIRTRPAEVPDIEVEVQSDADVNSLCALSASDASAEAPQAEPAAAMLHPISAKAEGDEVAPAVAKSDDLLAELALDLEGTLAGLDEDAAAGPAHAKPPAAPGRRTGDTYAQPAAAAIVHPPQEIPAAAVPAAVTHPPQKLPIRTPVRELEPVLAGAAAELSPSSALSDLFAEFKEEVEEETSPQGDDPETHYNLGVAFREMGLLDEAIGELQKVCEAMDAGQNFPRAIETYTWLAQCFLEKNTPRAAIRWYERALHMPGLGREARLALHYEIGCACQADHNPQGAMDHFMEVYGTNIDYRDVAERIKSLQSVVKS